MNLGNNAANIYLKPQKKNKGNSGEKWSKAFN